MSDGFLVAGTHIECLASAARIQGGEGDSMKFEHYVKPEKRF